MRVTNVVGAFIALFFALVMDWIFLDDLFAWVSSNFTGEMLIIAQASVGLIMLFVTFVVPILIAVSDDDKQINM